MKSATPKTSLVALFLIGAVASPQNLVLVGLSVAVLAIIWWEALSSPFRTILAAYLSLQWLQTSMAIWIAAAAGIDLFRPSLIPVCQGCSPLPVTAATPAAIALANLALAAVAIGARIFQPTTPAFQPAPFVRDLAPTRLLVCYLALFVFSRLTGPFVGGGLAQPLLALGNMRYFFVALLVIGFVTARRGGAILLLVYLIEIAQGLIGFFSGFKTVFYLGTAVLLTLLMRDSRRTRPVILASVVCVVCLGVFWTMIKPAYRAMLNEGSQQQVITLDVGDRFKALGAASAGTKEGGVAASLADLALRISYTEFLGDVMDYVPASREHTMGALWGDAVAFVLQPRFLFPDKPPLQSDSERSMLYTGRLFGSDSTGTSISIGYVAESYIDGGILGALTICFVLGAFYGLCGRILNRASASDQAAFVACIASVYTIVQMFEVSNMKLLPGSLWAVIVGWLFLKHLWPVARAFCGGAPATLIAARRLRRQAQNAGFVADPIR